MNIDLPIKIDTRVIIKDINSNEILVDKSNAIHSQNMARIIARALAHETNSWIYRIAFGNGGTFIDAAGNVVHNPPNDGSDGSWESRLYNETYSEIVDKSSPYFGQDLGSSDPNNTRPGGGADPADDPTGAGVVSQEAGLKSNVIVSVFLNENEPSGQLPDDMSSSPDTCFLFDEIGLYSPGLAAKATNGYSTVNVGNKKSSDFINLNINTTYTLRTVIDSQTHTTFITVPASGSGPTGQITYGDFCQGLNTGTWITSGDNISTLLYTYITDNTQGTYPTITGKQSYGYLIFQSKTTGATSKVSLTCSPNTPSDLMNALTGNVCANCNVTVVNGANAGVQNDPIHPENERERLLTHIIFDPILKTGNRALQITYSLTVSIARSQDSTIETLNR